MRISTRGCLAVLVSAALGYVLTVLTCALIAWPLQGVLPEELVVVGVVCVSFPIWVVLSFVIWGLLFIGPQARRETALRLAFHERQPLTDEAFSNLCTQPTVATVIRDELRLFIANPGIAERLLPTDPIRATCALMDLDYDDLDWAEFLFSLERRFGIRIPPDAEDDITVAKLVELCS